MKQVLDLRIEDLALMNKREKVKKKKRFNTKSCVFIILILS